MLFCFGCFVFLLFFKRFFLFTLIFFYFEEKEFLLLFMLFFQNFWSRRKNWELFQIKNCSFFSGIIISKVLFFQKLLFLPKLSLQDDYDFDRVVISYIIIIFKYVVFTIIVVFFSSHQSFLVAIGLRQIHNWIFFLL